MLNKPGRLSLVLAACASVPAALLVPVGLTLASPGPLSLAGYASPTATRCATPKTAERPADSTSRTQPVPAGPKTSPGSAPPSKAALAFARQVLREAVIPPGSTRTEIGSGSILAAAAASPAIEGLADVDSAYKVVKPVSAVQAYEEKHLPRGAHVLGTGSNCNHGAVSDLVFLSVPVKGGHEYSAGLAIGITRLTADSSLLRIDAQAAWVASRPAAEKANASAVLTLRGYGSPTTKQFTETLSGAQERAVTAALNTLPVAAPTQCAESSPMYQLQYTSSRSRFQATGYGCGGTILVAVNGKAAAPLDDGDFRLVSLMNSFLPNGLTISRDNSAGGWAGWVSHSPPNPPGQYETASADWTVPHASCDFLEMASSAAWVGIDGYGESTVEQIGTDSDCILGQDTYSSWWELYGTPVQGGVSVDLPGNDHIHPGDQVFAQVVAGHGAGTPGLNIPGQGTYGFTFVNFTENWVFNAIEPSRGALSQEPPNQDAEWIVEQPSCFWVCQALAKYGHVTFTGMFVMLNTFDYPGGPILPPADFPGKSVNLVTGSTLKESGSPLGADPAGGNTELVTFHHK
jgi:Peptidase A4 family